jgi:DNA-binding protein YbaB
MLMPDDRLDAFGRVVEEGDAFLRTARSAAQVSGAPGSDASGSVTVTLDSQGRVTRVVVANGWQRRLGADGLSDAVVEAVRDATMQRLNAWGQAYGEGSTEAPASAAAGADDMGVDRGELQRRLQAAATGPMSAEDRRAALYELLELAENIERGIDEVSGKLQATLTATHAGQSADRHVTVTVTGGGDVVGVRFDRAWLREAHELNVGRQITGGFRAAYEKVAAHGVTQLIADSPLGAVQRATQDPIELARRLRLTD